MKLRLCGQFGQVVYVEQTLPLLGGWVAFPVLLGPNVSSARTNGGCWSANLTDCGMAQTTPRRLAIEPSVYCIGTAQTAHAPSSRWRIVLCAGQFVQRPPADCPHNRPRNRPRRDFTGMEEENHDDAGVTRR